MPDFSEPSALRDEIALWWDDEDSALAVRESLVAHGHDPDVLHAKGAEIARVALGKRRLADARRRRLFLVARLADLRAKLGPVVAGSGPVAAAAFRALEWLDERDGLAVLEDERLLAELTDELRRIETLALAHDVHLELSADFDQIT